ncbi:NAD(P)/FAD-dependent oxidoreductase [Litchfieldia salsa]|uniref:Nitrite and sulphite reductase 4Fe-4S domain-containing protein n=1 Tax=Litchfieldia salsa TaxID=930152 RepID=A0A1H0WC82_9BACI|nr:nitrite reductase [Litchfieldia salsa]SDP87926.1 Nitrite and sulphite reductase 4Fe-4S domain-containing protein [Litchfieldia salsa]
METSGKTTKLAVNGGISFGSKLNARQLVVLAKYIKDDSEIELTTFQQLYIEVEESDLEVAKEEFEKVGLSIYPVGAYVKSLRTCGFCKGAEEEGMPVAIELNRRIAGREVPWPLRPAYTGCPNACGEPLVNDIGVIKKNEFYDLYVGGKATGENARTAIKLREGLSSEDLYVTVEKLLEIYKENGKKREAFWKFINRYGLENIENLLV